MLLENVLISFFYMWLSSFPSTTYWRDCLFSSVYSYLLCCRLIDHKCMGLFLGFLSCSTDLYVSGRLLCPCHLVLLLGFYLVRLSGTYSSVASFCLNFYFYFYVYGRLCFSTLEKCPPVGDVLCIPAVNSPLVTQGSGASWSQGNVWPAFADSVYRLLIVWPEVSQHWSLQAVGWGQVLVLTIQARCQPPGEFMQITTIDISATVPVPTGWATATPLPPQETLQDHQVDLA